MRCGLKRVPFGERDRQPVVLTAGTHGKTLSTNGSWSPAVIRRQTRPAQLLRPRFVPFLPSNLAIEDASEAVNRCPTCSCGLRKSSAPLADFVAGFWVILSARRFPCLCLHVPEFRRGLGQHNLTPPERKYRYPGVNAQSRGSTPRLFSLNPKFLQRVTIGRLSRLSVSASKTETFQLTPHWC